MTDADYIRAARWIIDDSSCWVQNESAVDKFEHRTDPTSPYARAWCGVGILEAVCDPDRSIWGLLDKYFEAAEGLSAHDTLARTNDGKPREEAHADVLAAFDAALTVAESDNAK